MTKEFVIDYTDWHGVRDTFFCHATGADQARAFAYWTLGDLIDIHTVESFEA